MMRAITTGEWTTPSDVTALLRRRWDSGDLLARHLAARNDRGTWEPLAISLRRPTATQVGERYGDVQSWVRGWDAAGNRPWRVERTPVGGRSVGTNHLPRRVWLDTAEDLWRLLQVEADVRQFERLADATRREHPAVADWIEARPKRLMENADDWEALLATVTWIDTYGDATTYLRQVDVDGVDTKFVERHRSVLAEMLDRVLPPERILETAPRSDLERRFGLRSKPSYVRLRSLDPASAATGLFGSFSEVVVRAPELAAHPPPGATVFVLENEVTFLALPDVADSIAVLGGGYAVADTLRRLPWLGDREVVYWGDLDTHGFAMLDAVREHLPHTRSMLMDRDTLLDHRRHWSTETAPLRTELTRLLPDEHQAYEDLVEGVHGPNVRLEQERVRFSAVRRAMASLSPG